MSIMDIILLILGVICGGIVLAILWKHPPISHDKTNFHD